MTSPQVTLPMETALVVSVSTAHVTSEDGKNLQNSGLWPIMAVYERGALLYVGGDEKQFVAEELRPWSQPMQRLILLAQQAGAKYLIIDGDGPEYNWLEKFDW